MALFSKGSAENRLTDIQRDKLPIRAVDVHKTKRVSTTHWLEKKNKKHWKSKTSKIFVIAFENGRRGKGVHVGRGWGRLNCRAHACDCTLSAPHVLLLVFCLFAPATFILRPVHFSFYFFFLCFSVFRFCSGNGNWMVKFRKMQFERTPETRDETVKAERQQNATAVRAAAASTGQQQQQVEQQ